MRLKPVNGHILVELPAKDKGIYIPEQLSDSQQEGVVIAVADDVQNKSIEKGVTIRWEKFAEADGSFEYSKMDGSPKVMAVLIKSQQVMGVYA